MAVHSESGTLSDPYAVDTMRRDLNSQVLTDAVLSQLLDGARSSLRADTAAILLLDASEQFLVATAARGIEEEVRQGARIRVGVGFAGAIAARLEPVVLDQVTAANVVNPLLLRRGIASMAGVPLVHERRLLGVLHVGTLRPRAFTADDVAQLQGVAADIATAILRHRVFVDRTAAAALQNSLASRLPEVPGLELAARYVPGSQYGIGGDWYDVFPISTDTIGITMGDVMGHGLRAATVMGRTRSALRAYAIEDDDPASVLTRLDRKMRHFEPGLMCTVLYGILHVSRGDLLISSAGHLPPVIAEPDEATHPVVLRVDPPIGVPSGVARRTESLSMRPESVLCLFTDGLVETRTGDIDDEISRLCSTLDGLAHESADATCAQVMAAMLEDRDPSDDISLLVAARQDETLPSA
jgi:phosphoserine phosphatase RsbU/P